MSHIRLTFVCTVESKRDDNQLTDGYFAEIEKVGRGLKQSQVALRAMSVNFEREVQPHVEADIANSVVSGMQMTAHNI